MSSPSWAVNNVRAPQPEEDAPRRPAIGYERTLAVFRALAAFPKAVQSAALMRIAFPSMPVRVVAVRCGVSESSVKRATQAIRSLMPSETPPPRVGSSAGRPKEERMRRGAEGKVTYGAKRRKAGTGKRI